MWAHKGKSQGLLAGRETIGPLVLMAITPFAAILFVYANDKLGGSLATLAAELWNHPAATLEAAIVMPTWPAIRVLLAFAAFELLLMRVVPGKTFRGPVTANGNVPEYKANGFQAFIITIAAFLIGSSYGLNLFPATIVYDYYAEMIVALTVFSFGFCLMLNIKGLYFPSSTDSGSTGNWVLDYYWGTELYPRILGWDVKMFTNCRFGMMAWAIAPISFAAANLRDNNGTLSYALMANVALQLVYVAKFFWWETGYLASIDIMHDRAGYYICWGCLVWVPSVYVSHSYYMVKNAPALSPYLAALYFALGWLCVYINYDADRQRAETRRTNGRTMIWGRPAEVIRAKYTTEQGEVKDSLLLVSGWWGVSRHFHYLPEVAAAFFWSVPGGFNHVMPYFYVIFLTVLLLDRAFRDDSRCAGKYGKYYKQYCERVPYKIVPGIL